MINGLFGILEIVGGEYFIVYLREVIWGNY